MTNNDTTGLTRRHLLAGGSLLASGLATPALAQMGALPDRPIRIVCPHGPGGASDTWARIVAEPMAAALGRTVVIENKPGASTMLAAETVARARPDGTTLLMGSVTTLSINPSLFPNIRYDAAKDFAPLSIVATAPMALAVPNNLPARNVAELVALAKARPGALNYGSPGAGTSPHLTGALFASMTGIDVVHVPYRTAAESELALMQDEIHFAFSGGYLPGIRAGRVRGLAMTSLRRSSLAPDLPTVAEQGLPEFESSVWNGLLVPAGTPEEAVRALVQAIRTACQRPEVARSFADIGAEVVGSSPQDFAEAITGERVKWSQVIRNAGLQGS
ncbi:Bug family tripartite tricarboxylate transporter substrate binding protein [Humitalea sp. 24SJ18S-53]|uniref:Bug family tripartite tricarboxylate transporter substrate binding protein n=1 Tax=Humitalea sp. 24SJ18S-53 TaxID=3422307 RepID=UPI003D66447A